MLYIGSSNQLNSGSIHGNTARNGAGAVNGGNDLRQQGYVTTQPSKMGASAEAFVRNLILNNSSIDHNHAFKDGGGIFNTGNGKWMIIQRSCMITHWEATAFPMI